MMLLLQKLRPRRLTASRTALILGWLTCVGCSISLADPPPSPQRIAITDSVPFGREPIDYFSPSTDDAVARLQRRIDAGKTQLQGQGPQGYLKAVLAEFKVPVESQLLVFSKTARNPELIGPKTPRAIYFNDDVSVAWVPGTLELEVTALEPLKGANFYTLTQPKAGMASAPKFARRDQCLACHAGRSTLEVPGLLLRAFQTDATGKPLVGYSTINSDTLYERRWGGWFVTGSPTGLSHRGNLISTLDNERDRTEPGFRSEVSSLDGMFRVADYPAASSDIVAHLVFAHQMHGLNLLLRVGAEARLQRRSDAEDRLLRYFVFADEPELSVPPSFADQARAASPYLKWFEQQGPRDSAGRSLRQFDLSGRLFRYRLSWLVGHPLLEQLPADCRTRLLDRLWHGLTDATPEPAFDHLEPAERRDIREIVAATIPALPDVWK